MVGQAVNGVSPNDEGQIILVKTDNQGNELWSQEYGGSLYDGGSNLLQTPDQGFLLLGWTRSFGAGERDFYLVKTDSLGNEEWQETYGDSNFDSGESIIALVDGNYLLAGYRNLGNQRQAYLYKIDSDGSVLWQNGYGDSSTTEEFRKVVELANGDIVGVGLYDPYGANPGSDNAGYLVRTDGLGNELWHRVYNKNQYTDLFYSVLATNDGGFLLSGQARNDSTNSQDAWLLKVDSIGCPYPNCLVGIDELGSQDVLVDVWPNPANDVLNLEIGGWPSSSAHRQAQGDGLSVTVVDMQGRVVCVDRDCHGLSDLAMTGTGTIDVSDWPNGLYVLTVTTHTQQASVRVVVQH